MVYNRFRSRRRYNKRPYNAKKTYGNNRVAIRKNHYKTLPGVYFFSRWAVGTAFLRGIEDIGNGAWPVSGNGNYRVLWNQPAFSLRDIVGNSEFIALFRYYKIHKVVTKITFTWENCQGNMLGVPATPAAPLWRPWSNFRWFSLIDKSHSRDWTDETIPPPPQVPTNTLFNAKQFNSFKMGIPSGTVTRVCKPQAVNIIDNLGSAQPAAQTNWKTWYLTSQPQQNFFGTVFGVQPVISNMLLPNKWRVGYSMDHKYYVSFRGIQ